MKRVIILTNPGDWAEVFANGESIYRGHESDIELDVILERLGIDVEVHRDVPVGKDNRTFETEGLDLGGPERHSRFVAEPGDFVRVEPDLEQDGGW